MPIAVPPYDVKCTMEVERLNCVDGEGGFSLWGCTCTTAGTYMQ